MPGVRRATLAFLAVLAGASPGAAMAAAPAPPLRGEVIGKSVRGRELRVVHVGDEAAPRRILVVGEIHGNEQAGIAVTRALRHAIPPAGVEFLVLDEANPDGRTAGMRGNAHGVDLNRSFPWGWRPLGPSGTLFNAGPRPSSEPETRAIEALVLRERPSVTIWYHQHLDLVDLQPGSSERLMRRYARISALPARHRPLLPGTASRWQDHRLPGHSAFVVELPAGRLDAAAVRRHVRAVIAVANQLIRSP